jgi:hypothetical protein
MRRAGAFFVAAVGLFAMALLVTGSRSILATGIVAVVAGLAFAAWPEEGMSVVGFVVCIPIVILQAAVGLPSGVLWLAVCIAAVFAPPAGGLVAFIQVRDVWGDSPAVLFRIGFLTLWLAAGKAHRTLIRQTATAMTDLIKPLNEPIDKFRRRTFA